ncbi:Fis family transcriptional regulator [Nitratiruptor sp. SB155-2]|uniref:Fis family transcriptional regulator n=1 Tax=Nitratiruptor sp. (strain SB155-2) TaxID=387092 RepID=UPI0001586F7B|nr:Fis family transcriptional regulator [Nitratiruptor sp. SB155-2]BAF69604.1 transcriptional regulator, Fis family [Nitratiruptor sp. SB155-2]
MQRFIARSPVSKKLLNTLRISSRLPVNILVVGEEGSGKMTLVKEVFPDLAFYSVEDVKNWKDLPQKFGIADLHNAIDIQRIMEEFEEHTIIALSEVSKSEYEEFFPVILHLPPLSERPEEFDELFSLYAKQVQKELGLESFEPKNIPRHYNAIELKQRMFKEAILQTLSEEEMLLFIERFLEKKLPMDYKDMLYIFEIPLLKAAKRKYKSALAISKALGLNRATLTKKLKKYENRLKNER